MAEKHDVIELERPSPDSLVTIGLQGIHIQSLKGFTKQGSFNLAALKGASDFGRQLNLIMPMLLEQDIAVFEGEDLVVPFENVHRLYDPSEQFGLMAWLPDLCPYTIQIEARGFIGNDELKYDYAFFSGAQRMLVERIGCFIRKGSFTYCLPKSFYELMEHLDHFNGLDKEHKTRSASLQAFAAIKSLSREIGANLGKYLETTHVKVPERVGLNIEKDEKGRISFLPEFDGIDNELLQKRFRQFGEAQSDYELATSDGGRLRLVINDELREALNVMRRIDHLSGAEKERAITAPRDLFAGIKEPDCVDLNSFGPRVKGLGPYAFQPKPFIRMFSSGFLDADDADIFARKPDGAAECEVGIEAQDSEGNVVVIPFADKESLKSASAKIEEALSQGSATVNLRDSNGLERIVPVSQELLSGIAGLKTRAGLFDISDEGPSESSHRNNTPRSGKRYVLIYDNAETLDYVENTGVAEQLGSYFVAPKSLRKTIDQGPLELKDFQRAGVAWLQRCFREGSRRSLAGRRGVLLADDMGLGKTLQVLTFLAWFIESRYPEHLGQAKPPYEPILVIAPKILLHNWKQELMRFFDGDGAIFDPFVILHGDTVKSFRTPGISGKEYDHGLTSLDLNKLRSHRLVITNYDTVKNYQLSFAQVEWSVLVVDEAQEIKEPTTTVTWAVKSLNSLYRIAMTGTPVENCLADLWNIMDFAQPGVLGTQKDFRLTFESSLSDIDETERTRRANVLRQKLLYETHNAYVIRRTKEKNLDGLPPKNIFVRKSPLGPEQEQLHREIIHSAKKEAQSGRGKHLKAIQRLAKIYQHVSIEDNDQTLAEAAEYVRKSAKLQDVVSLLKEIKQRKEKVLIFAIYRKMQAILKTVLDKEFGLDISVINGSTDNKSTKRGESLRLELIEDFSKSPGFNIMILSPDVAGVGLNIVAANNVIHYGRWWNPAKEAQATDRAYRIGQTKPVNVYYPISVGEGFTSFDEKLHTLLEKKSQVASDFLIPSNSLFVTEQELFDDIAKEPDSAKPQVIPFIRYDAVVGYDPYRFEALIAAIWRKKGCLVLLTPNSLDQGADIIAIKGTEVTLIQCKHSAKDSTIAAVAVEELRQAEEYYKHKLLPARYKAGLWKLACVTNSKVSKELKHIASRQSVDIFEGRQLQQLLQDHPVTGSDVFHEESNRLQRLTDISDCLASL